MIQRIQSVYLLLASFAGFGQFGLPYLRTASGDPSTVLPALTDQVYNPLDNIGLLGLSILSALISLVAIFLYNKRTVQRRVTGGAALCTVLLAILLGLSVYKLLSTLPAGSDVDYQAGIALPGVALVLQWLAGRSIKSDENLVKSMDRLR